MKVTLTTAATTTTGGRRTDLAGKGHSRAAYVDVAEAGGPTVPAAWIPRSPSRTRPRIILSLRPMARRAEQRGAFGGADLRVSAFGVVPSHYSRLACSSAKQKGVFLLLVTGRLRLLTQGHISSSVKRITDRFIVKRELDRGTFGAVFNAWDCKYRSARRQRFAAPSKTRGLTLLVRAASMSL